MNGKVLKKMKKILAFVLSASMCLSLLTVLAPAFAYEQESGISVMRMGDPDNDKKPDLKPYEDQDDNN